MSTILMGYVPAPNRESALSIAQSLLEEKLIACANIHEGTSMFYWDNKLANEHECIIMVKTLPIQHDPLLAKLKKIHPYKTPTFIFWQATCNEEYFQWINSHVKNHQ